MTTLREAAQQALEDICGARLCEVNSMSSRREALRLLNKAADTLRAALAEPLVMQVRPSDFAKLIKGKETMTGVPAYWSEWPNKEAP